MSSTLCGRILEQVDPTENEPDRLLVVLLEEPFEDDEPVAVGARVAVVDSAVFSDLVSDALHYRAHVAASVVVGDDDGTPVEHTRKGLAPAEHQGEYREIGEESLTDWFSRGLAAQET